MAIPFTFLGVTLDAFVQFCPNYSLTDALKLFLLSSAGRIGWVLLAKEEVQVCRYLSSS